MEYPKITALNPTKTPFSKDCITPEGVWVHPEHLASIENQLAKNENIASELATLKESTKDSASTVESLQAEKVLLSEEIASLKTQVQEKDDEITKLNEAPSGNGTPLNTDKDPQNTDKKVPSYADPKSPINQLADAYLK